MTARKPTHWHVAGSILCRPADATVSQFLDANDIAARTALYHPDSQEGQDLADALRARSIYRKASNVATEASMASVDATFNLIFNS